MLCALNTNQFRPTCSLTSSVIHGSCQKFALCPSTYLFSITGHIRRRRSSVSVVVRRVCVENSSVLLVIILDEPQWQIKGE